MQNIWDPVVALVLSISWKVLYARSDVRCVLRCEVQVVNSGKERSSAAVAPSEIFLGIERLHSTEDALNYNNPLRKSHLRKGVFTTTEAVSTYLTDQVAYRTVNHLNHFLKSQNSLTFGYVVFRATMTNSC